MSSVPRRNRRRRRHRRRRRWGRYCSTGCHCRTSTTDGGTSWPAVPPAVDSGAAVVPPEGRPTSAAGAASAGSGPGRPSRKSPD